MSKDYYKILGIEKNASADEIKKAFKKAAMQHHPDRPGGNEAKFKEVNEAYQVLSDAQKRQRYDQFGADFEQQGGFGQGTNWEDVMSAFRGGGFSQGGFSGGDFGDIFGDLFGGGRSRGPARGHDIQVDVEIDFKEAAFGVEKEINLRKQNKCDVCKGSGGEPGSKMETCTTCNGRGQVTQTQRTFLGAMQTVATCGDCHGLGKKPSKKCKHCGGSGVVQSSSAIKIKIPGGIDDGQSIRLDGQGETAPHGGSAGSLYVRVRVKPLKGFTRDGYDVYTEEEISYPQAVLGDKIDVETLDGRVTLVVPEGVESGQLIRIKHKGVQYLERNARGDQYVKIKIRVPKKLSKEAKKKLEELKEEL
ncbi:MAG: molecular chaperone DnaJ [Candidatus Magasanikbacteria bacterium]|nr:molecular chaperone DnaJ [Candidatus Magasanikbacteria bacterium]